MRVDLEQERVIVLHLLPEIAQDTRVGELTHDYDSIRKQLGVVSSLSQQLFRTTLESNLCVGAHAAVSVQEMKEACERVGILDTVMALRSGFQTNVGDSSGVSFSKSERQTLR